MTALLKIENLRIDYDQLIAVNHLSLSLKPGDICALVGPNGAGKSSLIKAIAGLIEPTVGKVLINEAEVGAHRNQALLSLGYMPEKPPLYEDLTVHEFLMLFASAYQIVPSQRSARIDEMLKLVKLEEKRHVLAGELSKGMKQRLFLAKTLLHDPKVLVLDEPADGLDPLSRADLAEVLKLLASQGKCILISSHILQELDSFCNAVCIMEKGKMLQSGSISDIKHNMQQATRIRTSILNADEDRLSQVLKSIHQTVVIKRTDAQGNQDFEIKFESKLSDQAIADLLRHLIQNEFQVKSFIPIEADLQAILKAISTGQTQ